jgi:hypothetical protein
VFEDSLAFLGFVGTPNVLPQYSTTRVLVTEWVKGQHLSALTPDAGLRMTRMAVEACTASLVLTGYVHADPHEGNLMLGDDGRVIFLDFGLMSVVEPEIMEAFARGIQAALTEDYVALAQAFKDTGFVTDPVQYKPDEASPFKPFGMDPKTGEDLGLSQFSTELAAAMRRTEGGTSRFGALATVLNQVTHQPISQSANQPISQSANQLISSSAHQPISPSAHPPISPSAHPPISPSTHQPISPSTHQPISPSAH